MAKAIEMSHEHEDTFQELYSACYHLSWVSWLLAPELARGRGMQGESSLGLSGLIDPWL